MDPPLYVAVTGPTPRSLARYRLAWLIRGRLTWKCDRGIQRDSRPGEERNLNPINFFSPQVSSRIPKFHQPKARILNSSSPGTESMNMKICTDLRDKCKLSLTNYAVSNFECLEIEVAYAGLFSGGGGGVLRYFFFPQKNIVGLI